MKLVTVEQATKIYHDILAIDVDTVQPITQNRVYLDTFANLLRPFLKQLGFSNRKISVVVPNYSMAQSIEVTIPDVDWYIFYGVTNSREYGALTEEQRLRGRALAETFGLLRNEAQRHLHSTIERAFPANGDRSDPMTDYFDDTFSVWH